jgi:hypothetical protein
VERLLHVVEKEKRPQKTKPKSAEIVIFTSAKVKFLLAFVCIKVSVKLY